MKFLNAPFQKRFLNQAVRRVGGPLTRTVPSFNGVDQYLKFAQAITGAGQGTLTLDIKLPEQVGDSAMLVDGDDTGVGRIYVYDPWDQSLYLGSGGLTTTVDSVDNNAVYGKHVQITIAGDMTGLVIGRLLSRWDNVNFCQCQLFGFSYKDDNTDISTDFSSGKGYELLGATGRNLVTQNATTTWDGTEADWTTKPLGITEFNGKPWEVTFTVSPGSTGLLKIDTGGANEPYDSPMVDLSGGTKHTVIVEQPTSNYANLQTDAGASKFIGTVTVEIREVPNALIYQNYSADQQATYVQQPNGDWKGKANLWLDGETGDIAPSTTAFGTNSQDAGEYYYFGDAPSDVRATTGAGWVVEPKTEYLKASSQTDRVRNTGAGTALSFTPTFKHLVKPSDYQRNQHYIQQFEKQVALYQAKDTSPVVTDCDGADDRVTLPTITLPGDYDLGIRCTLAELKNYQTLIDNSTNADEHEFWIYSDGKVGGRLRGSASTTLVSAVGDAAANVIHDFKFYRRGLKGYISVDGQVVVSATYTDVGPVVIDSLFGELNSKFHGKGHGFYALDHTAPLPIGQGGNSGYWPLNKAGDTADQVYGLDTKGNQVIKDGKGVAGHGTWQGNPVQEQYTYDKVGGSLLGPEQWVANPTLGPTWSEPAVGAYAADGTQATSNLTGATNLVNGVPHLFECYVDALTQGTLSYVNGTGDLVLGKNSQVIYPTIGQAVISAAGSAIGSVSGISCKPLLMLSPELQRLHDLALVEAQIAKLERQDSKAMSLLSLDRVDDQADLATEWSASGAFDLYVWIKAEGNDANGTLWGDNNKFVRSSAGALLTRGLDGDLSTASVINDDMLHLLHLSYDGTDSALNLDGEELSKAAGLRIPNVINRYGYYSGGLFLGQLGPLLLIDYAKPLNSRYYRMTATGMQDLLGDGSTDGAYQGNPELPKTFIKTGDDWYHADSDTTIQGA